MKTMIANNAVEQYRNFIKAVSPTIELTIAAAGKIKPFLAEGCVQRSNGVYATGSVVAKNPRSDDETAGRPGGSQSLYDSN
jgi:hypothetical protein